MNELNKEIIMKAANYAKEGYNGFTKEYGYDRNRLNLLYGKLNGIWTVAALADVDREILDAIDKDIQKAMNLQEGEEI